MDYDSDSYNDIEIREENEPGSDHGSSSILESWEKRRQLQRLEENWQPLLMHWKSEMADDNRFIKELCRIGIPQTMRPYAWFCLSGGYTSMQGLEYLYGNLTRQQGDPNIMEEIAGDLHQQFSSHKDFGDQTPGRENLFSVLKAFSLMDNGIGYCREQGPIAAWLLMQMPAEQAFWTLVGISRYRFVNYCKDKARMLLQDKEVLFDLLKRYSPIAYNHLVKIKIDPRTYISEWFLNLYTLTLPPETLLRIWDMFVYEGREILFKVALVLIKGCLGRPELVQRYFTIHETLEILKQLPHHVVDKDALTREVQAIDFSDDSWQGESAGQALKRRAQDPAAEIDPRKRKL
ncbi:TBC1 domain family member whacked-like [Venturia canescens]|uniref:TBC1 domain family member whacked-like n=1 Tax=Venturia canescens TaxID=32260 RepID=UPI001C9C8B59|nr:TBC1 domain family member whacked-like [Venturia canescens]